MLRAFVGQPFPSDQRAALPENDFRFLEVLPAANWFAFTAFLRT
jgi:hypothetical protein